MSLQFAAPALAGLHVLLVEDDAEVRAAVAELLACEGAQITEAADGEAALALLAAPPGGRFQLVVSDVNLGGPHTGFDVAAAALALRPALAVVLATGYAGPARAALDTLPDSVPVLRKPFRRNDLLAAIAAALPRSARRRVIVHTH